MSTQQIVKLDAIDKKILTVLLKNGRITNTELAQVIGNNYPTVRNRVISLVEKGVIQFFYPVVQLPGIGARRYMSAFIGIKNAAVQKKQEIINGLCKHPFLIKVFELDGRWDISVLLVTNYIKEANDALNFIQQLCGQHLTDLVVMPTYVISNLNRNFFSDLDFKVKEEEMKTGYYPLILKTPLVSLGEALKLGETDVKLLDSLKLNANENLEDLGKIVGIDGATVDYKIKNFIMQNLIKYFTIEVDSYALGYEQYLLLLNLRGSVEGKKKLVEGLGKMRQAYHYFEYMNYWEIVITFCVHNREEVYKLFSELQAKFSDEIKDHEIVWIVKKHKVEPYPDVSKIYSKRE